jgi:hypothetical protein
MAAEPIDHKKFDNRVIERHLRAGTITAEEYKKYLDSLPDEADLAEPSKVRFGSSDDR